MFRNSTLTFPLLTIPKFVLSLGVTILSFKKCDSHLITLLITVFTGVIEPRAKTSEILSLG